MRGPISLVDISLDCQPDLLFPTSDPNVVVMLNQGSGTFAGPTPYQVGFNTNFALAADFNGDGLYGIEATGESGIAVLLATAPGVFAAPVTYPVAGQSFGNASATDVNGDGYPDLVVGARNPNGLGAITTFINDGNGTFAGGTALFLPTQLDYGSGYVGAADLDLDGNADVLWWNGRATI